MSFFSKIVKTDPVKKYWRTVELINEKEKEIQALTKEELALRSDGLKERLKNNETLDDILVEAFALVRETAKRSLGQRHYDAQLIGGIVLHEGKIAEMMTGEGKTLAATLPVYLNALSGDGVHLVTVNDYLAKRDAVWMGQIYHALGLKVACLVHDAAYIYDPKFEAGEEDEKRDLVGGFKVIDKFLRPVRRREAYLADIVYGTNHEFGFDFLRDNISLSLEERAQRNCNYVIIDEVDSILIDEARTPLIISAPDRESSEFYKVFAKTVERLNAEEDYIVDEKLKSANITEAGIDKIEEILGIKNIFSPENSRLVHFLHESIKAKALFKLDRDYVVKNGEIVIVDEFTGRMLLGRRYSGGLHQAIEAKEGVGVKEENRTYAQITIQNYFRLYKKIAGMTGTAETSAEEFHKVYNLDVVSIPPNRPLIRKDMPDLIYKTEKAKYKAVVEEIRKCNEKGQPILIGTTSIMNNEIVSDYLRKAGIKHEILNAKNHEHEGAVIAQAGRLGAVTVATNMAGRGVDIILGGNPPSPEESEKVKEAGGLHVIGTERHEARRIDNQLRGRSGRQGDSGSSRFFLSLEDDLLRIFGGDRIQRLMQTLNFPEDQPIESGIVSKAVAQAQAKVEGANLDIRRHLLDFDDVLNKQRTSLYSKRFKILDAGDKNEIIPVMREIVESHIKNIETLNEAVVDSEEETSGEKKSNAEELKEKIEKLPDGIEKEKSEIISRSVVRILDTLWIDHLENLESLRESVNIRAYAQHEPLVEYRREAHKLYKELSVNFESLATPLFFHVLDLDLAKIKSSNETHENPSAPEIKKIGRNDPCHCGAKKSDGTPIKYKHCHGG